MAEGDHYREAERLSEPRPAKHDTYAGLEPDQTRPPEPDAVALAQVHATLAVADQLARVAEALDMLIQVQERD